MRRLAGFASGVTVAPLPLFALALILLLAPGVSYAAADGATAASPPATVGLAVEPGGLLIQDVDPGESYDLAEKTGVFLTIHNRDRTDHSYLISSHRPSEVGNHRLPEGYTDISDPSWLSFDQMEVRIPAQGSSQVRMVLRIPDDERYHNQHWSVSVAVVGKPEPGETLTLAVYPRFEIETSPATRAELHRRPAGEIGVAPSVVALAPHRGHLAGHFTICNNDSKTHSYRFTVVPRGDLGDGRRIFPSSGCEWLPDDAAVMVRPPVYAVDPGWSARWWPELWIGPYRNVAVPVRVALPRESGPPAPGREAVVLIERNDRVRAFVRLRAAAADSSG